jgi:hypothetical protein
MKKLFIHIPKSAGMTIRRSPAIRSQIQLATPDVHISPEYSNAVLDTMNRNGDHHGFEHARWRDIHPRIRNSHKAFAIIRNPWDRVTSRYFFAKKVIEVEKKSDSSYADISSFEAFLEERHKWGGEEYMWHRAIRGWFPAFDHVSDEQGNVQCEILNFHTLDTTLPRYFGLLEAPERRNITRINKGTYRDVYTPETIQIVADWYKKDIDYWGFDFDTGPTRNYLNV